PLHPTAYENANSAPGPILIAGTTVTWTYLVMNTGSTPLDLVSIQDDGGVANNFDMSPITVLPVYGANGMIVGDNGDGVLDPNETWLFSATGTVPPGAYTNPVLVVADVEGEPTPTEISATDVANLYGTPPGIAVKKYATLTTQWTPTAIGQIDTDPT